MRRFLSSWPILLAVLLVAWLLFGEFQAGGGWAALRGRERTPPDGPPSRLQADLERRAQLRGLPGIERGDPGEGRMVGHVHVVVADRTTAPLPGVEVAVLAVEGDRRVHRTAKTDEEGAFAFDRLPALVGYALVVRRPPWREIVFRGVNVARNRTTDAGTLLLGAPTIVRGEVVDAAGRPIAGAKAGLFLNRRRKGSFDLRASLRELESAVDPLADAETARDGTFVLADVPPGRYVLRVSAPGYATAFRDDVWVSLDEHASAIRVVLDPGAGFFGVVRDGHGHGIGGARVIAVALSGDGAQGLDRTETRSAPDGSYRLDSLVSGKRTFLEAWAEGFAPRGWFAVPQGSTEKDLVLEEAGRVEGRITVDGGTEPVAGAEVFLVAGKATGISPLTAVSDASGRFVFESVVPGPVLLCGADAEGYVADSFSFGPEHDHRVAAGKTTTIDVRLVRGVEAEGSVLDDRGRGVPYATVAFLDPHRRSEGEESALTDDRGRWHLAGLREATYEVRVQAAGFAPLVTDEEARVEVRGPGVWRRDFTLDPGATVHGRVLDPDGAGVAGARLHVVAAGGGRVRERVQDLLAVSGATGAWRIQGVPPHTEVRVEARHDGWARGRSPPLRLAPGEDRELDLALGEGVSVRGHVSDGRGHAVDGAHVRWGPLEGENDRAARDAFRADQRLLSRAVETDAAGGFVIPRLEPGRWLVKVEREGYAPTYRRDLLVTEENTPFLAVTLEPSHDVQGRVTDARSGRPIEGAWVYAREMDGEEQTPDPGRVPGLASSQTDEQGRYRIVGLAPDRAVEVVAWLAPGYRGAVQTRDAPEVRRKDVAPGSRGVDFALLPDDGR